MRNSGSTNRSTQTEYVRKPREREGRYNSLRPLGPFTFVPLVTAEMKLVGQVTITMFRPEPPGRMIVHGGDIDNRLKTLFDALTMPRRANALPPGVGPAIDEDPFFTVLEDDALITSVTVTTEHLLRPVPEGHVELIAAIQVTATSPTMTNQMSAS